MICARLPSLKNINEEIDFEGLNSRINVRQAQIRVMPTFGEEYELQIALEDPNPEIPFESNCIKVPVQSESLPPNNGNPHRAAINSFGLIPAFAQGLMADLSKWALLVSIAAVGMKTSLKTIFDVGGQAIILIVAQTVFIAGFILYGITHFAG